jgi:hypothetical protein
MNIQTEKHNHKIADEKLIKDDLEIIHSLNDLLYSSSLY